MDLADLAYYVCATALWVILAALLVLAWLPGFPAWLAGHPQAAAVLLGTSRLPEEPRRTLRRFYGFLTIGWSWLLAWSWWLLPWLKVRFYEGAHTLKAYQLARTALLILLIGNSAFGFFCIGKGIQIWIREIYRASSR